MQERKVLISRVIKSARVLPKAGETPQQRISKFVEAQQRVVAYPFSPEVSIKALGQPLGNSKDPSADNKQKRKKAQSKFSRFGVAIFDPGATPEKGQYFEVRPRNINQDGQLGDVPNIGWLDPRETVEPENLASKGKKFLASRTGPSVRKVPAKKNPRTGAMEVKALGGTIGRAAGNIGQTAARAIGIVVDGNGRFRCPPGVPAANQFTDEVGSNCFDFSPLVARALVNIAQKFGQGMMEQIGRINSATPFERDEDYRLVSRGSSRGLRSAGGSRPLVLMKPPYGPVILPDEDGLRETLLGPDGKPISTERIAAEEAMAVDLELAAAERDIARMSGLGEIVDPDTYEEKFEEALRAAYPELSNAEIKSLAKIASERERMRDKLRAEQRSALETIRSLGIDVDENDPVSVQRGIALALLKMKEMGWDIDIDSYFGKGFSENPERALLEYRKIIAGMALDGALDAIEKGIIHGLGQKDLELLANKYGPKFREDLLRAIVDGSNPSEVFPDDERAQQLLAMGQRSLNKARQFETGAFLQLINARRDNPELTKDIKSFVHAEYNPGDPFFAAMDIGRNGNLVFMLNLSGMLLEHPAESLSDSDSFLYEPTGTAGTEIEKLKRIGEVVTAENRNRLLGSYMENLTSFATNINEIQNGEGFITQNINDSFGGMALGQFVAFHELTHARQLLMAREIIKSRNPGMPNSEAMALLGQMIFQGRKFTDSRGVDFDYGTMISDPQVMLTACANMRDIVSHLLNNKVGGTYGASHYFSTFYLNEAMTNSSNYAELTEMRDSLYMRYRQLEASGKNGQDAEFKGLLMAISRIDGVLESATDEGDALLKMRQEVNRMAQVTYLEMQADLSAAVKFGLIEETPEIKAFLAPLSLGQDLPEIQKNIVPPPSPDLPGAASTRREKIRQLAAIGKRARKITLSDLRETLEGIIDMEESVGSDLSTHDRGLMSSALGSATRFGDRGSASRWGKQVRDIVLGDMTEKHREVIEDSRWRNLADVKTPIGLESSGISMRHRLAMGDPDDSWLSREIEDGFIPFVEVVGESKLPNSVAAEIVIPGGLAGEFGDVMQGRRIEIGAHFTGVLKSDDSLGSPDEITNPLDSQRLIIAVPEGYSGLPDYTPGTNRSEVGSIILPPGEIEIIGVRDDGVAVGRVVSQRSADELIDAKREELKTFDEKLTDLGEKITVRKAINRLERQQEIREVSGLRSAGNTAQILPEGDKTKIPSSKSSRTRDILERLDARGIKFGKSDPKERERKRNERLEKLRAENTGTSSVKNDLHEFESPEDANKRVSQQIERAIDLINEGKLPGLAPEVAEILKDKSPEEIRSMLLRSARSFVDGLDKRPRFRIRGTRVRDVKDARDIPLLGFLKTGVYKTTYDADSAGVAASSDAAKRSDYEVMLGIPETVDESIRPAHGFLTHRDQIEFEDQWKKAQLDEAERRSPNAVSFRDPSVLPHPSGSNNKFKDSDGKMRAVDSLPYQYGDSEIVLGNDAASRSVGTMGDSLNGMRTPFELDGSSTDDELLEAFILNRSKALEQSGGGGAVSANSQRRIANLLNASIGQNHAQTTDWTEDGGFPQRDYVEAIVAGSFNMSEVEEIRISKDFQDAEITPFAKVEVQNVGENEAVELLQDFLPTKDIDELKKLLSSPQAEPDKKRLAQELREIIAARLQLVRERKGRREIRGRVARHSTDGNVPKVTFLNQDGINIDDHRTFKRTMDALGMGEQHEIDDIVRYATAKAIRDKLSSSGIGIENEDSFAAIKPKPVVSVLDSATSLRSGGAGVPKTRTQILGELANPANRQYGAGRSRRLARRADSGSGRIQSDNPMEIMDALSDLRSSRMSSQGRQNTTDIAQREILGIDEVTRTGRTTGANASLRSSGSLSGRKNASESAERRSSEILDRAAKIGVDMDAYEREQMGKMLEKIQWSESKGRILSGVKQVDETRLEMARRLAVGRDQMGNPITDIEVLRTAFGEAEDFGTRLIATREIARSRGNNKLADQIDELIKMLDTMPDDEFDKLLTEAKSGAGEIFDTRPMVRTDDPMSVIKAGRYFTVHDRAEMEKLGATSVSERFGRFDVETIMRPRKFADSRFFNLPSEDDDETRKLRPASGFVMGAEHAQARAAKLKQIYGDEIEIQHDYSHVGREATESATSGTRTKKNSGLSPYGNSTIILRPETATRTMAVSGDSVSDVGTYASATRLSNLNQSEYIDQFVNPMSLIYSHVTGDKTGLAAPMNNQTATRYTEAMVLGSFVPGDVQAIVADPSKTRKSPIGNTNVLGINPNWGGNLTSIIDSARTRDELMEQGIDLVIDSPIFPLDEVEPFNPKMTRIWVERQIANGKFNNVGIEDLIADENTTPYEAWLRYMKTPSARPIFDHPDNVRDEKLDRKNADSMIDQELSRINDSKITGLRSSGGGFGGISDRALRSSGASVRQRTISAKISEGPRNLQYGTDSQNLPRVATADELEQRFGNSAKAHRRYFRQYGIRLKGEIPSDPVERETYYASLQALDDLFQNVDPKKLIKGQRITVRVNAGELTSSVIDPMDVGTLGEMHRSRPIFFSLGKQRAEVGIHTERVTSKARQLAHQATVYEQVDGLKDQILSDFVSRLFISKEALRGPDAENEIARRLAYASMIHEGGHLLDYLAVKKEDRIKWRPAMSLIELTFGPQDTGLLRRGSMMSVSMEDELKKIPAVSRYGASNQQEKMAEAFTAWWLFSKRPDISILGDLAESTDEPSVTVPGTMGDTYERVVRPLLEELGPRVKSAKQNKNDDVDDLPPLVTLYALLPFMIEGGGKA